jgi:AcrR family transcriptional regulator
MAKPLSSEDVASFRARLCAAAERLFATHGVENIGIRQLAQALGCSPMTPYRYFRDKQEILAVTRAAAFDRFAAALEAAAASAADPVARANAVGQAYVDFALGQPNAYRLMFDLTQPGEENYPDLARAGNRARRTMTAHIEAMVEAGLLEGDPVLLGHAFWAAVHGVVSLQLAGKLDAGPGFQAVHREAMRLMTRGASPNIPGRNHDRSASPEPVSQRQFRAADD